MSEREFRLVYGVCILVSLYFDLHLMVFGIIALMLFEGITNWRLTLVIQRLRNQTSLRDQAANAPARIPFDSERALRLVAGGILTISYIVWPDYLWLIPWFMGFAFIGAGLSGVCPMLIGLKFAGFR